MEGHGQDQNRLLDVQNLSITIDREEILHGVSFSVKKGEALVVIGPNGAGKTMLFRALLGLVPYQGAIAWQEGVRIGYVPQKFLVDRSLPLTVQEFFLLKSKKFWHPAQEFMLYLRDEFWGGGLPDAILQKPVSEVSGGEFQRILISWAMLNHPEVLLFDEPTAGIDIGFEETIYTLIHRLRQERGTTILLISHDLDIVYRYAEQVLCINKRMLCHGRPNMVLRPQELAKLYGEGGFYQHLEQAAP